MAGKKHIFIKKRNKALYLILSIAAIFTMIVILVLFIRLRNFYEMMF